MFRTAVLRSVARVAARPAAVTRFAAVAAAAPRAATAAVVVPKIQSFQGVRFYSAGGALNKEEVEGRIMSLLQGFDKVSFFEYLLGSVGRMSMWVDGILRH